MKILHTAHQVLNKISENKVSFSSAISEVLRNDKNGLAHRKELTTLVGCALRHYIVLEARFNSLEAREDAYKNAFILVASAITLLSRDKKECLSFLKENTLNKDLYNQEVELIDSFVDSVSFIPQGIEEGSLEYLSYRYNTPLWIIKMWRKHYGYRVTRKAIMANNKHFVSFARFNPESGEEDEFKKLHKEFEETPFPHFYTLMDKSSITKTLPYIEGKIFAYPPIYDEIIALADTDSFRKIAAFTSTPNQLLSALSANLSSYVTMDYLIGSEQAYFEIKKERDHFSLKNTHLYEGEASGLITCVSENVHTMFVLPNSSNFSLLRNTPDYFLRFDQNSLDNLIIKQSLALEEAKDFVEDGGYLVYIVPTLSKKESISVIAKFLYNNEDFKVVKQEQIFPFEEHETSLYYAILKKGAQND